DPAKLGFGLLRRRPRCEPSEDAVAVQSSADEPRALRRVRHRHDRVERAPEIDVGRREMKTRWHHADDRVRLMAHDHLLADHIARAAESLAPEPIADRDDWR